MMLTRVMGQKMSFFKKAVLLRYAPFSDPFPSFLVVSVSVSSSCDCCAACVSCPRLLLFSACVKFLRLDAYPCCLAQGRTEKCARGHRCNIGV